MWQRRQLGVLCKYVAGPPELYTLDLILSLGHAVTMPGESEKETVLEEIDNLLVTEKTGRHIYLVWLGVKIELWQSACRSGSSSVERLLRALRRSSSTSRFR